MIEIIHIILLCIERKVTLRSVSDGYVFEDNIDSKTLAFTFGLVSEIERKLVSIRTKEALALIRSKGVVWAVRKVVNKWDAWSLIRNKSRKT